MDIFSDFWTAYRNAANALPDAVFYFLINAVAVLLIPALFVALGFIKGWRNPIFRWGVFTLGILVAVALPLEQNLGVHFLRPWVLPFLILGSIYLPHIWAFLIEPRRAQQKKIRQRIQIGLLVLFGLNLIWMIAQ